MITDNWIAEVRSDISQRIAAVVLFGIVEWMGISALLSLVAPATYHFFKVDTSRNHWWFEFAGALFF